ncbi:hypothetical protein D3C73_1364470 [compost metagenome]
MRTDIFESLLILIFLSPCFFTKLVPVIGEHPGIFPAAPVDRERLLFRLDETSIFGVRIQVSIGCCVICLPHASAQRGDG